MAVFRNAEIESVEDTIKAKDNWSFAWQNDDGKTN